MRNTGLSLELLSFIHAHLAHRKRSQLGGFGLLPPVKRAVVLAERCGATIVTGGRLPFYDPVEGYISMPPAHMYWVARLHMFAETYAAVVLHELCHWSGHKTRLNRVRHTDPFDDCYRREELVAEFGSALLAFDLGLTDHPSLPNARYLAAFLATLPSPKIEMEIGFARASAAVGYIHAKARRGGIAF